MKTVLAFGNPLLDFTISSDEKVTELIKKYNLNPDGQKEFNKNEMENLFEDIKGLEKYVSPGGCCQNSLRVLQWILRKKGVVSIFGSVGKDPEAEILKNILTSEGVHPRYVEHENLPTGKTVALVKGLSRSLVAHVGVAEVFPIEYLRSYPNFTTLFELTDIVFVEVYFLTNRFETVKYIINLCQSTGKVLVCNLCGDYIFNVVPEPVKYLVRNSHIVFGNIAEYKALTRLFNFHSVDEMVNYLITENECSNASNHVKTLVITDGGSPIICHRNRDVLNMTPPHIKESDVKDTTGAGDAFIGGFLAGLSLSKDTKECIEMGFYAATNIIKQRGCSLPPFESDI